ETAEKVDLEKIKAKPRKARGKNEADGHGETTGEAGGESMTAVAEPPQKSARKPTPAAAPTPPPLPEPPAPSKAAVAPAVPPPAPPKLESPVVIAPAPHLP